VDLPEGPRIQAVLSGAREDLAIGIPMQLELETLRETPEGEAVVIHRFRPAARARGPASVPAEERP
jgi:hypothetical protein